MKLEKLVGERFRERPADCAAESHALMLRGGYMKSVANGIYSSYTPLRRITQKIESILREEMDAIDGQEVLFDRSLENADRLVCGANAEDYHFSGLDMARDVPGAAYRDFAKISEGGVCPRCGKRAIRIARGIEVGNIFQLGTKYTKAMHMTYVDREGREQYPVMGCYGIGVGRLAAAVCEARRDEHGPIWPVSIAPWQVHLCAVRHDDASVGAYADGLYDALRQAGVEVIYDDRPVSAGVMFADADLLGVPLRRCRQPAQHEARHGRGLGARPQLFRAGPARKCRGAHPAASRCDAGGGAQPRRGGRSGMNRFPRFMKRAQNGR